MTFSHLCTYFQSIEDTASRLAITELLARLFSESDTDEIGQICYLLQGRVAPLYEPIEFGVADKFMIRAIARAHDVPEPEVAGIFKQTGDLGATAQQLAERTVNGKQPVRARQQSLDLGRPDMPRHTARAVSEVYGLLSAVARATGTGSQETKVGILTDLLHSADPLSSRYLARIPLGKLRLGFSDMTILDGLSWMIDGDKSHRKLLERAYDVRPDLGYLAISAKRYGIRGIETVTATVGAPILAALCQRLPNAAEMIAKMGMVEAEPKYDGVRTQIHFRKGEGAGEDWAASYSRNLENTTPMYPELRSIGASIRARSVILDSEAVGYDEATDRFIPFQETVTRKRKYGIESASRDVPLKFFVFDIIEKDGRDLMHLPLSERRRILTDTVVPGTHMAITPHIVTQQAEDLRRYHDDQLSRGLEGIVVKKLDSTYEPGRRGYSWVKYKEEEGKTGKLSDTVDCVIMGYTQGEGKRSAFGIGAFLVGIRDAQGQIATVTRIGTGVSDEQWIELERMLSKLKRTDKPKEYADVGKLLMPDYWIEPDVVVEIAADDITKSPVHSAGYALRFPRLVRIRTDKTPDQATTVTELASMYRQQTSILHGRRK